MRDGNRIDFRRMMVEAGRSRAIFVGETHTSMADHRLELQVVKALHRQGIPLAIGLEMFTADSQPQLDAWVAGSLEPEHFIRLYYGEWRMPWSYYRAVLTYARDRKIPLVGLNVPEGIAAKVAREGFAALSPAERAKIPPGVTCSVDAAYREFIRQAYREHRQGEESFASFCEAQMLWNKAMAWHLADYLRRFPQRTVVVLSGTGHTLKRAIPGELAQFFPVPAVAIMPVSSGLTPETVSTADTDYLVFN
ncbi:MAG TPA: ChaN family lipoprotein [Geobacteraceae bacterium]